MVRQAGREIDPAGVATKLITVQVASEHLADTAESLAFGLIDDHQLDAANPQVLEEAHLAAGLEQLDHVAEEAASEADAEVIERYAADDVVVFLIGWQVLNKFVPDSSLAGDLFPIRLRFEALFEHFHKPLIDLHQVKDIAGMNMLDDLIRDRPRARAHLQHTFGSLVFAERPDGGARERTTAGSDRSRRVKGLPKLAKKRPILSDGFLHGVTTYASYATRQVFVSQECLNPPGRTPNDSVTGIKIDLCAIRDTVLHCRAC